MYFRCDALISFLDRAISITIKICVFPSLSIFLSKKEKREVFNVKVPSQLDQILAIKKSLLRLKGQMIESPHLDAM